MKREDLAEEIRGAGFALRYADGPVMWGRIESKKHPAEQSTRRKLKESDWVIVRRASTCHTCGKRASDTDIEFVESMASNYQDFGRLIWLSIKHARGCDALSDIAVSEAAKKKFAKAREKWTRKTEKSAKKTENKAQKTKPTKSADEKRPRGKK
jgi:hypothetical protein